MINWKRKWVVVQGWSKNDLLLVDTKNIRMWTDFYYLPSIWEFDYTLSAISQKLYQFKSHGFRFWVWSSGYQERLLEIGIFYRKTTTKDGDISVEADLYYFGQPGVIEFYHGGSDKVAPEAMDEFGKSFPEDAAELALARKNPERYNLMSSVENVRLRGVPWEPFTGSFREKFLKEMSK